MTQLAVCLLVASASATAVPAQDTADAIQGLTTIVTASAPGVSVLGTGFYFQRLGPANPAVQGPQWRAIEGTWVVTNRHVLLPEIGEVEQTPSSVSFHLREIKADALAWDPVTLDRQAFEDRARCHPDPGVDVAVLKVTDLITQRVMQPGRKYAQWNAVSREDFPGANKIGADVGDDVLVAGYPLAYYDKVNLFPIVKAGIVASRWGARFDNSPYFLIDAKLLNGSSGSIVITKPTNFLFENGRAFTSERKQFAFLGVYSGQRFKLMNPVEMDSFVITEKRSFDLGLVWYPDLIETIIDSGVACVPKPTAKATAP